MSQQDAARRARATEPEKVDAVSNLEVQQIERPTGWVDRLLQDVMAFDESMFTPPGKIEEGETVLGECTLYMRKLYAFSRNCEREAEHQAIELKHMSNQEGEEFRSARMMHEEMDAKHKLLRSMFWAEVNDHFKRWGDDSCLAVVKGWKITSHSHDRNQPDMRNLPPHVQKFLKMLNRGGGGILGIDISPADD
jgi:hypothetical protein